MADPSILKEISAAGGIATLWLLREVLPIMLKRGNGNRKNGKLIPGQTDICRANAGKITEHETRFGYIQKFIDEAAEDRRKLRTEMLDNFRTVFRKLDDINK